MTVGREPERHLVEAYTVDLLWEIVRWGGGVPSHFVRGNKKKKSSALEMLFWQVNHALHQKKK